MKAGNRNGISIVIAFAVFLEVLAVVLAFCPTGSLAAMNGAPGSLIKAAMLFGMMLAGTVLLRLVLPGPGAASPFFRKGGSSFTRTLYYGFAAAVLLTFYRAALLIALKFKGTEFFTTLPTSLLSDGPFAIMARVLLGVAAAYLFFGYVQGFVGSALGRRAGLVAAAALAATTAIWPAVGGAYWIGSYPSWAAFLAWRLPEALALAYLCERTRNVLAPVVAAFLLEWFSAVGIGLYGLFGDWPFLFACLMIFLASAEILVAERRRIVRGAGGLFALLLGRTAGASLPDAVIFAAALAAGHTLARALDLIEGHVLPAAIATAALLAGAITLWFVGHAKGREGKKPALEPARDESSR
jgi:hypothetical protein